ncbi:MAG: hypothetical protein ABSE62_05140 [Chthoniobacteraceae bacterium]|jgi:hypothetical protein
MKNTHNPKPETKLPAISYERHLAAWYASYFELATTTTREIFAAAELESKEGGFLFREAIPAIIGHYKRRSEKVSDGRADAMRRKEEAEAGLAEIALMREAGETFEKTKVMECLKDWGTKFSKRMNKVFKPQAEQIVQVARESLEEVARALEKAE